MIKRILKFLESGNSKLKKFFGGNDDMHPPKLISGYATGKF